MSKISVFSLLLVLPAFGMLTFEQQDSKNSSQWVAEGKDGKLVYKTTEKGDRIMDFSHAGYLGGGVAIPEVPVKITINPSPTGADQSDEIQAAVDAVSKMNPENGFRGAILLASGRFVCSKPITMGISGVVVRGSGSGKDGSTIYMTGNKHAAFIVGFQRKNNTGKGDESGDEDDTAVKKKRTDFESFITDSYVGCGTNTFHVSDAKGFSVGDRLRIDRPVTASWISFMQMNNMTRDGKKSSWVSEGTIISQYREISHIEGNKITVKVPLADSFDSKFVNPPGVKVSVAGLTPTASQVGIENLHVQCPPLEIAYSKAPYSGVDLLGSNCWIRNIFFEETMNTINIAGNNNTIQQVKVFHTYPNLGASKPADFSFGGTQNLVDRCEAIGGNTYFVWTSARNPGPNVVLNSTFKGHGSRLQPHQRWSTALLIDNCTILDGGIDFMNRGIAGSGHGWTMGWGVAWNCIAKNYIIQNTPGTKNWAIGCIGENWKIPALFSTAPIMPDGEFDSPRKPVWPQSLYLAQLAGRLGPASLKNIGYSANSLTEFKNKHEQTTPPLKGEPDPELGADLGLFKSVSADNERNGSRQFAAEKVNDADKNTCWATSEGVTAAAIVIDTEGPLEINAIKIDEANLAGCRVLGYKLESQTNNDWTLLAQGTTIGKNKTIRFDKIVVWKVRLTIIKAEKCAAITKFGLFLENIKK